MDHWGIQIYHQTDSQKYMEKDGLGMVFELEIIIILIIIVLFGFHFIKCCDLLK
jgi:hypothetical protein